MSSGQRWLAGRASSVAERVQLQLVGSIEYSEVAGSLRRGETEIGDIEIVCTPRIGNDLFGDPLGECRLHARITDLIRSNHLRWRTETHPPPKGSKPRKYYPLVALPEGIPLDVFAVRHPAQWGAILAIRTGPAEFSKFLVTECQKYGLRCIEGHLEDRNGEIVRTPTERDFFRACRVAWVDPSKR